jgi:LPXTG-motif cell wall-anchored protein
VAALDEYCTVITSMTGDTAGMVPVKISQLIVAAGIAAVSFVGVGGSAAAAPPAGETPTCAEGVLTTVTDDNGVQHLACVAVAAAEPAAPAVGRSALLAQPVGTSPAELPKTGTGTGGLIIAALLVGTGSIASLLSRRKRDRP